MNKQDIKRSLGDRLIFSLDIGVHFFFFSFLIIYIGKYGLSNFIISGESTHVILLNISIWYVLVMYNMDKFLEGIERAFGGNHK